MPYTLLSPLCIGLAIALLLIVGWRRLSRGLRALLVLIEVILLASTTPICANALVRLVESRVRSEELCAAPPPTAIVVLGAGFDRAPEGASDIAALHGDKFRPAIAGIALWRRTPDA